MEILKNFQVRGASGFVRRTSFDGRIVDFWAPPQPTPYLIVTHDGQNIVDKATAKGFADKQREKHKLRTSEAESTDAVHSCGLSRSSDEPSVMEVERRG